MLRARHFNLKVEALRPWTNERPGNWQKKIMLIFNQILKCHTVKKFVKKFWDVKNAFFIYNKKKIKLKIFLTKIVLVRSTKVIVYSKTFQYLHYMKVFSCINAHWCFQKVIGSGLALWWSDTPQFKYVWVLMLYYGRLLSRLVC